MSSLRTFNQPDADSNGRNLYVLTYDRTYKSESRKNNYKKARQIPAYPLAHVDMIDLRLCCLVELGNCPRKQVKFLTYEVTKS